MRFILQVFLWFGIPLVIWISMSGEPYFIQVNGSTFLLQAALLLILIYYAVPQLLFKNRVFSFVLLIVLLVLVAAYLGVEWSPTRMEGAGGHRIDREPLFFQSQFFRKLLMMSVTCLSAIVVETFTLAQQKLKSEALAKTELKESELKFLKMQINPHFLFNSLNNIYALSVTNSEKTQEGISTLSLMLRYVLYDCEHPKVLLSKELEYIAHFIELFKLKSSSDYNIEFIQQVEDDEMMIAPMLFVPFIENAFKHSGIQKRGDQFVKIRLQAKKHTVEFSVENSLPTEPHTTDPNGGIGIQNVEKRLDLLYPGAYSLNIEKTNTFYVELKVNLS